MVTRKEIADILGPIGIDWDFEEAKSEKTRGNRWRVLIKFKIKKHRVALDGKGNVFVSFSMWGTGKSLDEAQLAAVQHCMVWVGLLPELAESLGIQEIIDHLGPLGIDWGVRELQTIQRGKTVRAQVEVTARKKAVAFDGRGKGDLVREEWGVARSDAAIPEDDAIVQAIRNCMAWMCITDPDVRDDEPISSETTQIPANQTAPKSVWNPRVVFGFAAVATVIGFVLT
jgi:hypothetical protein